MQLFALPFCTEMQICSSKNKFFSLSLSPANDSPLSQSLPVLKLASAACPGKSRVFDIPRDSPFAALLNNGS